MICRAIVDIPPFLKGVRGILSGARSKFVLPIKFMVKSSQTTMDKRIAPFSLLTQWVDIKKQHIPNAFFMIKKYSIACPAFHIDSKTVV